MKRKHKRSVTAMGINNPEKAPDDFVDEMQKGIKNIFAGLQEQIAVKQKECENKTELEMTQSIVFRTLQTMQILSINLLFNLIPEGEAHKHKILEEILNGENEQISQLTDKKMKQIAEQAFATASSVLKGVFVNNKMDVKINAH